MNNVVPRDPVFSNPVPPSSRSVLRNLIVLNAYMQIFAHIFRSGCLKIRYHHFFSLQYAYINNF